MLAVLRDLLLDPRVRALDPDSTDFSLAHRDILLSKPLVRALFRDFYARCRRLDERYFSARGTRIEIGSGSGFMRESFPDVVTSDIKPLPFLDLACRAERLPLRDASVQALYGINTFHHIPSPSAFFAELTRVLAPGGGVILIEPYHGPLARFLFRRLHESEGFDADATSWDAPASAGPFTRANQALSYIVFRRDRARFERDFPALRIVATEPHTNLRYLLSGGVNFRPLAPSWMAGPIGWMERLLAPLHPILALQHTIVLRRE